MTISISKLLAIPGLVLATATQAGMVGNVYVPDHNAGTAFAQVLEAWMISNADGEEAERMEAQARKRAQARYEQSLRESEEQKMFLLREQNRLLEEELRARQEQLELEKQYLRSRVY
jgi:hypothetical protein